ncbi:WXG100 family type VII secretion target [Paenibacillus zeisoli]|uniref:WXG100 family type VII secretion target n=1 Tax=Paenibacillus zeisoli TaxID=2496267 RepID=A0A433X6R6_9BACL|nr:WXG100 family type VII secretion target [Paenibacillus zeisoli]RUT29827.1 WXG100 family type VII secretion target [Paenibacillus zeisoli]
MMRIRMEPEQMRTLSKNLQQSAEQLRQMAAGLNQLLHSLIQESGPLGSVTEQWQQAHRLSEQLHTELHRIGRFVETKADAFQGLEHEPAAYTKGTPIAAVGTAAALYAGLLAVRNPVILPGSYKMHGVISNPESAVQAVRNEKNSGPRQKWEMHTPGSNVLGLRAADKLRSKEIQQQTSVDNMGAEADEHELLQVAVNNPPAWKFTNPSAVVHRPLKLRRIRVIPGGKKPAGMRHLDKLFNKQKSSE